MLTSDNLHQRGSAFKSKRVHVTPQYSEYKVGLKTRFNCYDVVV